MGQGPPAGAPISVRLAGEDPRRLALAAERYAAILRDVPGTIGVRESLGVPEALGGLSVRNAANANVPLAEVAALAAGTQTSSATRRDGLPMVAVMADVQGRCGDVCRRR